MKRSVVLDCLPVRPQLSDEYNGGRPGHPGQGQDPLLRPREVLPLDAGGCRGGDEALPRRPHLQVLLRDRARLGGQGSGGHEGAGSAAELLRGM